MGFENNNIEIIGLWNLFMYIFQDVIAGIVKRINHNILIEVSRVCFDIVYTIIRRVY